ncbi:PT repeat/fibro-slime domain containing protein [Nitzschia inconspicua]|uniref:PT repeat/fibro-slime domain containing protein n=1 Tax=Nitzschia inconspicua TaxID=303405 RepID=A0A9K3PUY3_9STRA|nr:PT repeat/fibro-slime domain containing protein [Nitzschia inconspicua]
MRPLFAKILTILAAATAVVVATTIWAPELLPSFLKKYIRMIKETKDSYEKWHNNLFVPEEISSKERERFLKKKGMINTNRRSKKKKGGTLVAPTNNPTPNLTKSPKYTKTSPATVPDFTIFVNIMKDANMTQDEKLELCLETYAPLPPTDNECLSSKGGSGKGDSKGEKSSCNSGKSNYGKSNNGKNNNIKNNNGKNNNGKSNKGKGNISSKNNRNLSSGGGKGSDKGSSKGQKNNSSSFTTVSGGTCLCSCGNPELTQADKCWEQFGPPIDCDNGSQLTFNGNVILLDKLNSDNKSTSKGGKGGRGKGGNKSRNRSRRVLHEIENRQLLICGPDQVSPFDPISPEKIALINDFMSKNDVTCNELKSYMVDKSSTCAKELNNSTDAPSPTFQFLLTGQSVILEDVNTSIGGNFQWQFNPIGDENIVLFTLSGIPDGTTLSYNTPGNPTPSVWTSTGIGSVLNIPVTSEKDFQSVLGTLYVKSAPQTDLDFVMIIGIATDPIDPSKYMEFEHRVTVIPVPDPAKISTTALTVFENINGENKGSPLNFTVITGEDQDNSETLSLVLTIPSDEKGLIGKIIATSIPNIDFRDIGNGAYTIDVTGPDPLTRQNLMNEFIASEAITFVPRENLQGNFEGKNAIKVEAISTEKATGESATTVSYIDIIILENNSEPIKYFPGCPTTSPTIPINITTSPSSTPSKLPSQDPSLQPSAVPSLSPSSVPSSSPSLVPFYLEMNNTSVIIEDLVYPLGLDIQWNFIPSPVPTLISSVVLKNIPAGTTLTYTDPKTNNPQVWVSGGIDFEFIVPGDSDATIRATLDTLTVLGPPQSDEDFSIIIVVTTDPALENNQKEFIHPVKVQARADAPMVAANNITVVENLEGGVNRVPLYINVNYGADRDNSEVVSLVITIPADAEGVYGSLTATSVPGVVFTDLGGGIYTVDVTAATPSEREILLNNFLGKGSIKFTPRENFAGELIGQDGIKVEAISTEGATGYGDGLAPKGTEGDLDPRIASDIAYISVFVIDNSSSPSSAPSRAPSSSPSVMPSTVPSKLPSSSPSSKPSQLPSQNPSLEPSVFPSLSPSSMPSSSPSSSPSLVPFYLEMNNTSVIIEDLVYPLGLDIQWNFIPSPVPTLISSFVLKNIPAGTTLTYTNPLTSTTSEWVSDGVDSEFIVPGDSDATIRATLDTLTVLGPPQSDEDFSIIIVVTTDPALENNQKEFIHPVKVQARADAPMVAANNITVVENLEGGVNRVPLYINVNYGADRDNSEVVSLVITIPADAEGVYGSLTATSVPGVAFTDLGGGIYTVNVTAANPSEREILLNNFLGKGSIKFTPRENFAGELIGQDGIKVEAISTEGATGYGDGLAPKGTEGDLDPRIASDIAYISVFVIDNSSSPSSAPSRAPSSSPSVMPSTVPSKLPSSSPSSKPSQLPSQFPSLMPSSIPSSSPSLVPFYLEMNNTSVIIEDLVYPLGLDIQWNFIPSPVPTLISSFVLKNIPAGTTLTYTNPLTSTTSEWVSDGVDSEFIVPGDSDATIRATLDTLTVLGPPQSDEDFSIIIVVTTDPALENNQKEFIHPVKVQARADAPMVAANNITVVENLEGGVNRVPLYINVNYGADRDNSEVVSLVITIPADAEGVYGSLTATSVPGVAFTDLGGGIYTVNVTAANPSEREILLNNFLGKGSIKFTPRENFAGELIGQDGIKVEAISTEGATGYGDGLAPKGTEGDLDPRIASDIAYISVFVIDNSSSPSSAPSRAPSSSPSVMPSTVPSKLPSFSPSSKPSQLPSQFPSLMPSSIPSSSPSLVPFYLEMNNTSVIIEDLVYPLGLDIQWNFIPSPVPTLISSVVLKNIPAGTTLTYTDPKTNNPQVWVSGGVDFEFVVPGDSDATIRATLDTLTVLGPPQSDEDFSIIIVVTTDPALENNQKEFIHPVKVQARADAPMVAANNITVVENLEGGVNRVPLYINVNYGADRDNSEVVSLVITIPADAEGVYGSMTATSVPGVAFTDLGGGIYTVNVTAATPSEREILLNNFLGKGSIKFTPRENFAGELIGQDGIKVEAISTEGATGYGDGLAPKGTEGDLDPRIASDIAYISVFVIDNSSSPSSAPSRAPSSSPSVMPSTVPSKLPSSSPSSKPSQLPSQFPSLMPSSIPSSSPSLVPFYLEMNNTSVIIEDLVYPLGLDIQWNFIPSPVPTLISSFVLKNIPAGTTLTYTNPLTSTTSEWVSDGVDSEFIVPGDSDATIRATLDTLTVLGPPQSDEDFSIIIVVTTDPALENNQKEFIHPVKVQARADAPMVAANNITVVENLEGGVNRVPLYINVNYGADRDNSEVVSLVITIPADAEGVYGSLTATSVPGVAFTDLGGGIYTVNVTAANPSEREILLNNFLGKGSIKFTPRENFAGELIGQDGIKVEAISTEGATGYGDGLAPKGTEGDLDPRIASDIAYISVFVIDNSSSPSSAPSRAPSSSPSVMPSTVPSKLPSFSPSSKPSQLPSQFPSLMPSSIPSSSPSLVPFYLEMNNTSVIIEDLVYPLGLDIQWNFIPSPVPTLISSVVLKNIPAGTTLTYTDPKTNNPQVWVSGGVDFEFVVPGDSDATIRATLDTLTVLGPPQSDEDFSIIIVVTTDPALENNQKEFIHPVKVQARADAPMVAANNITVVENLEGGVNRVPLYINVNYGADRDNSEVVSLVITIPADAEGVYGSMTATSVPGVAFTDLGGGIYTVNVTAATPSEREILLNNFLGKGSIKFTPRENFAGELIGQDGIKVEAISTEGATGYGDGLAPKGTEGDLDPRIASDIAYISVFVIDNSSSPSSAPSRAPSSSPSVMPSTVPSKLPSSSPSSKPSQLPSQNPSLEPSVFPSLSPSSMPSSSPSSSPSLVPFYLEMNNTSVIIEDLVYPLGLDIQWNFIPSPVPTLISSFVLKNIPAGTTLTYTNPLTSTTSEWVSDGVDSEFIVPGDSDATIRATLDTLTVLGPPQSDEDFSIIIVVTTDPALENNQKEFIHPVKVQARADAPMVAANNITVVENLEGGVNRVPLYINVNYGADRDNSEVVSLVITIPADAEGVYGSMTATSVPGVAFTDLGGGIYTVNVTAATPSEREILLNNFLGKGSIKFTPRENFAGELIGQDGIKVEAISTEGATGYGDGLAPKGTEGDLDPRIASDIAYISVFVIDNSSSPSSAPSRAPSSSPSVMPSTVPSKLPSSSPSSKPSQLPSQNPSLEPSVFPSLSPSSMPSSSPSSSPSLVPFYLEMNNTSVIIEDLVYPLGLDIQWNFIPSPVPTLISSFVLKNIPAGTTLTYTNPLTSTTSEWVSDGVDSEFIVPGDSDATIRATLDTLTVLGPPQSDEDFSIIIVVTTDPALENNQKEFIHPVKVQARADAPVVIANNLTMLENLGELKSQSLFISVVGSADMERDDSELISVVIKIPHDDEGAIGMLSANSVPGVVFYDLGGGVYTVNVTADTSSDRLTILNNFLGKGSIKFTPRQYFVGELIGSSGIKVEAISTERATGYGDGLAPKGTEGDLDPRIALDIAYISLFIFTNSQSPSTAPTVSSSPSHNPSGFPSLFPSSEPSSFPSNQPSVVPSSLPSHEPSATPSIFPSLLPSSAPSQMPSSSPSMAPSRDPSSSPSAAPSLSSVPSSFPSSFPSFFPSSFPSFFPSNHPSVVPSSLPSREPSVTPSTFPSLTPSSAPSQLPSSAPSTSPSSEPSSSPSDSPSYFPYPFEISGTSTLVEDVPKIIGKDFNWEKFDTALVENIAGIFISNFPIGSTVSYEDIDDTVKFVTVADPAFFLQFEGSEAEIVSRLDKLSLLAPLNSDEDFALNVTIRADTDNFNKEANYIHQVKVQAVADPPNVGAEDLEMNEDSTIPLKISASSSLDKDNSEVLSMVFKIASDSSGIIGTLTGVNRTDNTDISIVATFTGVGNGVYTLNVTGPDADTREMFLSQYLNDKMIQFTPREHWSGQMINAIKVEAVSTENALGYGDQLAPNDSPADGTEGDEDTKIEVAVAYISITVYPVNEELGFTSTSQIVPENGGTQDNSRPTLVDFGRVISEVFNIPDQDGSQSVSLTFVGFPDGSDVFSSLSSLPPGAMLHIFANNTVILFGNNVVDVHNVLSSLQAIIPDDSDKNFILTVTVEMTDAGAGVVVVDTTVFTHSVVIQAVADIPTVIVPQNISQVEEGADFSDYPVTVGLNDRDGSETYETIVIQYSTPGNGKPPEIRFKNFTSVVFDYNTPGRIIITGDPFEIEQALLSMEVKPGVDNGEDITIVVNATSVESNPSEVGPSEILIPTASKENQFVIDVIPVVGEITFTVDDARKQGLEDTEVSLGIVTIDGALDLDGSELFFLEFKADDLPQGLKIKIDGKEYQLTDGIIVDGYIQLPGKPTAEVALVPPLDWSGSFDVVVRGAVTDTASDGDTARSASGPTTISVDVFPVGDCFDMNKNMRLTEDQGPANIGIHLANTIELHDNGDVAMNNNDATETVIQIDLIGLVLQGTYVPAQLNGSSIDGFGNTHVTYTINAAGNPVYSITSKSTPTGASTAAEVQQIEGDIRTTLQSFTYSLISQSDASQTLNVEVTSLDVNLGIAARHTCSEVLTIAITAVADEPTVSTTNPQGVYIENGPNIPLNIIIGASMDGTDGSEDLIVTITVPQRASWDLLNGPIGQLVSTKPVDGVVMTEISPGVYRIMVENTAAGQANNAATDQANKINIFLAGLELNPFEYWAGTSFITVDVTSVEEANKDSATVTSTIEFSVLPVAGDLNDSRFKANARGFEDEFIRIPMELQVMDRDGSERFEVHIDPLSFPSGTTFYKADGSLINANATGWITVTQEDAYQLRMKAPPNWSTMGSGEIKLQATAEVIDEVDGFVSRKIVSKLYEIEVYVTGVARGQDEPEKQTIVVLALEDEAYDIGSNIDVSAALVDNDGSEQLFLTLSGLPRGVFPFTGFDSNGDGISDGITLIDAEKGIWQISQEAIPHLKLPPVKNYSGGLPYPKLTLQAFTQEIDLNMSESVMWDIFIEVAPVADGIPNFDTQITAREGDLEQAGGRLSLAAIGNHMMSDQDNSEYVVSYTIDFSTMIDDAQIRQRLLDLDPSLDEGSLNATYLIENYLEGSFVNNNNGTVTVTKGNIGGLFLRGLIFWDLSGKWKMRITALIRDEAMIDGVMVSDDAVTEGEVEITVLGTADIPTVTATDASGLAGELILVQLGGESTDTDLQLGRVKSETIYYFLSLETDVSTVNISGYVFTNANGELVGFESGEGSWFFTYEDLQQDIFLRTNYFANGTMSFLFTAVAAEDDTIASNSKNFEIDITYNPGPGFMEPPCWTIGGAYYNNATGKWVTDGRVALYNYITNKGDFAVSLKSLRNGLVTIGAPEDFSGSKEFKVEVIAKNMYLERRSTGIQSVTMYWEPVADGVEINVETLQEKLFEDQSFNFNISYSSKDIDGSEIIGDVVFIQFEDERVQLLGYEKEEGPFSFQGHVLSWYYIISSSDLEMLEILPPLHWHGALKGSIYMNGTEILAPNPVMMSRGDFIFQIEAVADVPLLTAPTSTMFVNENDLIQLPDLSATLVDTVTENGREFLSVIFEGVPLDSFFSNSAGVRVGEPSANGVWTIYDPADLSDIMFRPPPYWSGTLTLKLTATVIELSNGSTVVESLPFEIVVEPVASPFEILTNDIELPTSGSADLRLNIILLDDRGSDPGENPPEIIVLSFTDVPDFTFLRARKGGSLQDNGSGMWTFTGTQDQANSIQVVNSNAVARTYFVSISGKTQDVGDVLDESLSDDFPFRIFVRNVGTPGVQSIASGAILVGTAGNDILYATALADQTIDGGDGMDIIYSAPLRKVMTGGAGADQFVWRSIADLEGVMDTITDFSSANGDQLNIGGLLPNFDIQMDDISQFIRLIESPPSHSVVEINDGGEWKAVVRLDGVVGTTAQALWEAGNLLV